jgi:purine-binding chemotaxis protein CheW
MSQNQQFCTFLLDDLYLGVEVHKVQEVLRYQPMTPVPLAPPMVRGLINLRGQIVTAIDLRRRLGMPSLPPDELPMNVVIRSGDSAVSLLVDEIGDVVEVSDQVHEHPPENLRGPLRGLTRGVYKLDGRLLLSLDTDQIIEIPSAGARPDATHEPAAEAAA